MIRRPCKWDDEPAQQELRPPSGVFQNRSGSAGASPSVRRVTERVAGLGSLFLALALMAGCGSTGNSLTGGGIPVGRAAVEGSVVDSLDANTPVADAEVTLEVATGGSALPWMQRAADTPAPGPHQAPDSSRGAPYVVRTRTDAGGAFAFAALPEGAATIRVAPPMGMPRRAASAQVTLRDDETASIAVAVEPDAPDFSVESLTLNAETIEVTVGQPVQILATAKLPDGHAIRPSWVVEGGIGRISPHGAFVPLRAGSGQIRVRAGSLERVVNVVVLPASA